MVIVKEQCRKGGSHHLNYYPQQKWDNDTAIQWGGGHKHHINMTTEKVSNSYFIEVFPNNPNTFIRVDGLTLEEIEKRAVNLTRRLCNNIPDHFEIQVVDDVSMVGGGALPSQQLPTKVIAISSKHISVKDLEKQLRESKPSIIARINKEQLRIDLRTVNEKEEEIIEASLRTILNLS